MHGASLRPEQREKELNRMKQTKCRGDKLHLQLLTTQRYILHYDRLYLFIPPLSVLYPATDVNFLKIRIYKVTAML